MRCLGKTVLGFVLTIALAALCVWIGWALINLGIDIMMDGVIRIFQGG